MGVKLVVIATIKSSFCYIGNVPIELCIKQYIQITGVQFCVYHKLNWSHYFNNRNKHRVYGSAPSCRPCITAFILFGTNRRFIVVTPWIIHQTMRNKIPKLTLVMVIFVTSIHETSSKHMWVKFVVVATTVSSVCYIETYQSSYALSNISIKPESNNVSIIS